jgi:hypothetical protein
LHRFQWLSANEHLTEVEHQRSHIHTKESIRIVGGARVASINQRRAAAAVALANATGTTVRGFHSNTRSSTANKTAATGEANVADIPPAAPATSNVLRSAGEMEELRDDRSKRLPRASPPRHARA